jgi:hypothetical protein
MRIGKFFALGRKRRKMLRKIYGIAWPMTTDILNPDAIPGNYADFIGSVSELAQAYCDTGKNIMDETFSIRLGPAQQCGDVIIISARISAISDDGSALIMDQKITKSPFRTIYGTKLKVMSMSNGRARFDTDLRKIPPSLCKLGLAISNGALGQYLGNEMRNDSKIMF